MFQRFIQFLHWIASLMPWSAALSRRRRGITFALPTSITITPHTPVVVVGDTTQLYAVNQLGQIAPSLCAWSSSDVTKATINATTGLVTGVAAGTVTFTVSYNSGQFTNSTAAITVAAQVLTTAVMTTAPSTVVTTNTVTFAPTGYDQLGHVMVTQPTNWVYASSATATATINSSTGVATGVASGTTNITATSGGVTTPAVVLTDVAQKATTLVPSPSSLTVGVGASSSAITAGVFDQVGSPISGATLSFSSSDVTLATVNGSGVVTGVAVGSPVITVSSTVGGGTATGTVNVTVNTVVTTPSRVIVYPSTATLTTATTSLRAVSVDGTDTKMSGRSPSWTSSNTAVATVNSSGVVTPVAAGSATITATDSGITGTCAVTVAVSAPTTVKVTGSSYACNASSTQQLNAATYDQGGVALTGRTYTWSSSATGTATVSTSGLVTGVANGGVTITVTDSGASISGTTKFTVGSQSAASVSVTPTSGGFAIGDTVQLSATTFDRYGTPMPQNSTYTWSSDTTSTATVSSSGLVTGVGNGGVGIKAVDATEGYYYAIATLGFGVYTSPYNIVASPGAYPIQLAVTDINVVETTDAATSYTTGNVNVVTIDPPTLTGASSPSSITQGTGPITFTWPCTSPRSTQTLGGLTTGVTASAATVVDSTHISFDLTATGSATVGTASVYLVDSTHGNSNTESVSVNSSVVNPPLAGALRRYLASAGTNTTTNGALITSWTDQINSKVATQAANGGTGSSAITYLASGIGGKPCIQSASTTLGEYLTEAAYDAALNTSAFSAAVIIKSNTTTTSGYPVFSQDTANGHGWDIVRSGNNLIAEINPTSPSISASAGTTAHTLLLTGASTGHAAYYMDNTLIGSSTNVYSPNTSKIFKIFNNGDGGRIPYNGDIAEIIIWDHELSSTERTTLASYVSTTYGI